MPVRSRSAIIVSFIALAVSFLGPAAQAQTADTSQNTANCSCVCAEAPASGSADGGTAATGTADGAAAEKNDAMAALATGNEQGPITADDSAGTTADGTTTETIPTLRLSELLPDPVGRDTDGEFIELENYGSAAADLGACRLSIPGKRDHELPETSLGAHELYYFLYAETGLALTNSGATLELSCSGRTLSSVSYTGPAKEGSAYAIDPGGVWRWTSEPTPGRSNSFPAAPTAGEQTAAAGAGTTIVDEISGAGTEPSSTEAAEPANEPPASAQTTEPTSVAVAINEFLPDPVGSDDAEWIELRNDGGSPADLTGWRLDDAEGGSRPYAFPAATTIAAKELLVIPRSASGIALNNDGDQVRLFDATGRLVSEAAYDRSKEGFSDAWNGQAWIWSEPTPGLKNPVAAAATAGDPSGPISSSGSMGDYGEGTAALQPLTVADAIALSESDLVLARGVVNIAPGTIGKTIFGIQDTDGGAGIAVRLYGTPEQQPAYGDEVEVSGRLTGTSLGPRLNVSARTGLKILRHGVALEPMTVRSADLPDLDGPLLVNMSGEVTKIGRSWFKLVDDSGGDELLIRYSKSQWAQNLKLSDRVELAGVWRSRSAGQELFLARPPRPLIEPETPAAGGEGPTRAPLTVALAPVTELAAAGSEKWLWPMTAAASAAAAAGGAYLIRRRKYMFDQELAADVDK